MKQIVFNSIDSSELEHIIGKVASVKHTYNNYYGIDLNDVEYYKIEDDLFLRKKFDGYSRIYLMANDEDNIIDVLKKLPSNYVINIPSKKDITDWLPMLKESGYKNIAVYHRYVYTNFKKGNDKYLEFAQLSDIECLQKHLHFFFSPLTGHLPNDKELSVLINNQSIVVNRDENGEVSGALCYKLSGRRAELPFWFDKDGNGLSLLYNVFSLCHKKDVRSIQFWVNDVN